MNKVVRFEISAGRFVLIDTWWNVNYFGRVDIITAYRVLIDTWWNVNLDVLYA